MKEPSIKIKMAGKIFNWKLQTKNNWPKLRFQLQLKLGVTNSSGFLFFSSLHTPSCNISRSLFFPYIIFFLLPIIVFIYFYSLSFFLSLSLSPRSMEKMFFFFFFNSSTIRPDIYNFFPLFFSFFLFFTRCLFHLIVVFFLFFELLCGRQQQSCELVWCCFYCCCKSLSLTHSLNMPVWILHCCALIHSMKYQSSCSLIDYWLSRFIHYVMIGEKKKFLCYFFLC